MGQARKWIIEKEYVQVPNTTAQAVEIQTEEKSISLAALGLIVNLWSYPVEKWDLHKTELYKRYEENKKTSVKKAWDELKAAKYIVEYKYRVGKGYEYVYYYKITPFTDEEVQEIFKMGTEEHGKIYELELKKPCNNNDSSTSDFGKSNLGSTKSAHNKEYIKEKNTKEINIVSIVNNKTEKNVKNPFDKEPITKDRIVDTCNQYYGEFAQGRWNKQQWLKQVDKIAYDAINIVGVENIRNIDSYFHGVIKRMAFNHDMKQEQQEEQHKSDIQLMEENPNTAFYNWLNGSE